MELRIFGPPSSRTTRSTISTASVRDDDVRYLLGAANRALDGIRWTENDVIRGFVGLRTLPAGRGGPAALSRSFGIVEPARRLLVPVGGKYTSARADAVEIVNRAVRLLGRPKLRSSTADRGFPWRPNHRYRKWARKALARGLSLGVDEGMVDCFRRRYGSRIEQLFDVLEEQPGLAARIVPDAPFCLGEVVHAVRHEMAGSLEDVLLRRIPLLLVSRPSEQRLSEIAHLVGRERGWSAERTERELTDLIDRHCTRAPGAA